jgi:hypothetical protein
MNSCSNLFSAFLLAVAALLGGCGSKPPGCADPQTMETAKAMAVENTDKLLANRKAFDDDPDGWLKKFYAAMKVEITGVVSDGYKQDAKKQLCKGTMKITMINGHTLERSVEYSTQKTEDQKDGFLLEIQEFAPFAISTANEARTYFDANRWTGDWNGTYACSGVNGAADGPQGPYSLPVTMMIQGPDAKLERTTRGGGIELLKGKIESITAQVPFKLYGEGHNSPDDKWNTNFAGTVTGKRYVADGAITVRGETLRQCQLDVTLGGPAVQQSHATPSSAVQSSARFTGRFASHGESDVTADIGEANAAGKYKIQVTTKGLTSGGGGCGGVVEDFGGAMGNALKLNAVSDGQACELLLKLEPDGKLTIEESQGCSYFHGAACGFSDTLTRVQ